MSCDAFEKLWNTRPCKNFLNQTSLKWSFFKRKSFLKKRLVVSGSVGEAFKDMDLVYAVNTHTHTQIQHVIKFQDSVKKEIFLKLQVSMFFNVLTIRRQYVLD